MIRKEGLEVTELASTISSRQNPNVFSGSAAPGRITSN